MPSSRVFCSEVANASSMLGTAEQVDAWLLLEYKPSWEAKAIADGQLAQATQTWLHNTQAQFAAAGMLLRPQLVRQPELDREETRVLLSLRGQIFEFAGVGYEFLQQLDLLALAQASASEQQPATRPLYFVCTNGKRDLCCSRFGLPVYQRLRELVGDRVWQVTHLGGHRFAPNVLVAPHNVLYGRLQVDELAAFVEQVDAHQIDYSHLRGRTVYPKAVQAAEGGVGQQDLKLLHVSGAAEQPGDVMQVEFAGADRRHRIEVKRAAVAEMIQGSCGDTDTKAYFPFETRV